MLSRYPSLKKEPEGQVFPVFVNITSQSEQEPAGGTSPVNIYNASAMIDHAIWVVESRIAQPNQIGIATPYAGQVAMFFHILNEILPKAKPEYEWATIRIGSTDWWMGRQAEYMILDLVRASNDYGELGFMADGRRLNVSLSRQMQALVIFGDQDCVKTLETGDEVGDRGKTKSRNHENRYFMRMVEWIKKKGRLVDVDARSLSQQYIKLTETPAASPSAGFDPVPDGPVDLSSQSTWAAAPPVVQRTPDVGGW